VNLVELIYMYIVSK